jgi:hypothetical protein
MIFHKILKLKGVGTRFFLRKCCHFTKVLILVLLFFNFSHRTKLNYFLQNQEPTQC